MSISLLLQCNASSASLHGSSCWQASKTMPSLPTRLALSPSTSRHQIWHGGLHYIITHKLFEADFNVTTLPEKRFSNSLPNKQPKHDLIWFLLACSVPNVERPLATFRRKFNVVYQTPRPREMSTMNTSELTRHHHSWGGRTDLHSALCRFCVQVETVRIFVQFTVEITFHKMFNFYETLLQFVPVCTNVPNSINDSI